MTGAPWPCPDRPLPGPRTGGAARYDINSGPDIKFFKISSARAPGEEAPIPRAFSRRPASPEIKLVERSLARLVACRWHGTLRCRAAAAHDIARAVVLVPCVAPGFRRVVRRDRKRQFTE
jgi:hypothetical protein